MFTTLQKLWFCRFFLISNLLVPVCRWGQMIMAQAQHLDLHPVLIKQGNKFASWLPNWFLEGDQIFNHAQNQ